MNFERKLSLVLVLIVVVVLIGEYFYYQIELKEREAEIEELYNKVALSDSLKRVSENGYERLAVKYKESQRLLDELKGRNSTLTEAIEKKNAKIRFLSQIKLRPDTVFVEKPAVEETTIGGKTKVSFSEKLGRIKVWGYTETPPPRVKLNVSEDPIELTLVLTQDKIGRWRTYVDSPIKLSKLETKIVPYKPSWRERLRFKLGFGVYSEKPIGLAGVGFGANEIFLISSGQGFGLSLIRSWNLGGRGNGL